MFNWLHLTDLHWGLSGQSERFANIEKCLFDDLRESADLAGPWNVVLFTGDLVQRGSTSEFQELERTFLSRLRSELRRHAGFEPLILAVPGNHDLDRNALSNFEWLTKFDSDGKKLLDAEKLQSLEVEALTRTLFARPLRTTDLGCAIEAAFANYMSWWTKTLEQQKQRQRESNDKNKVKQLPLEIENVVQGWLPGDFSATVRIPNSTGSQPSSHTIGIVGLNTTFVQLAAGDYRGKLMLDPLQLRKACGDVDPNTWVATHEACILLTHQGASWLTQAGHANLRYEINPPGRFALHLYGHEHELDVQSRSLLGGPSQNTWQGSSLFGMEANVNSPYIINRRHGYSFGRIDIDASILRLWPRQVKPVLSHGWIPTADRDSCEFTDGDESIRLPLRPVRPASWQAVNLESAQQDLIRELSHTYADDKITIRHLGLDMNRAKEKLPLLFSNLKKRAVTLQLLTLSAKAEDYPGGITRIPEDLKTWIDKVPESVEWITEEFRKLDQKHPNTFHATAKYYAEVPSIHGFSLEVHPSTRQASGDSAPDGQEKPSSTGDNHQRHVGDHGVVESGTRKLPRTVTYFTFCRWAQSATSSDVREFKWGEERYWKICSEHADALSKDMYAIFDGAFKTLWLGTDVWYSSSQVAPEEPGSTT